MKTPIPYFLILTALLFAGSVQAQIPMERVLSRISIPARGNTRGLVDTVGFPHTARQMDFIGKYCEKVEKEVVEKNRQKYHLTDKSAFIYGICPHDDYTLAAKVSMHVQRYMKAKRIILIGNAHWSQTFGIRNRMIFGDFQHWRGPYAPIPVSRWREKIRDLLPPRDYTVNRTVVASEHSLEALLPFLQYYNRKVEIIPILIPLTDWKEMNRLAEDLATVVAKLVNDNNWRLGRDIAILCSTDGQHYGDYGWSYYDFHPFGCTPSGYQKAMELDDQLITPYLCGEIKTEKLHQLYGKLIDESNIVHYRITWCGRFSVTFASNFASRLTQKVEHRPLYGIFLRHGSSIAEPWVPVQDLHLGITGDTNLHHFVTYFALGFL